jgi:plastocyanin
VTRAICCKTFGALILVVMASMARAATIQVKMEKLGFVPAEITAHAGDTIEWVNSDFVAHPATARDSSWDVLITVNAKKTVVLKTEGTVDYYCKFHPNMTVGFWSANEPAIDVRNLLTAQPSKQQEGKRHGPTYS